MHSVCGLRVCKGVALWVGGGISCFQYKYSAGVSTVYFHLLKPYDN